MPGITELWVVFGVGESFRLIVTNEITNALCPPRCMALPMFHAFTGCDTMPFLGEREKQHGKYGWHLMISLKPSVT